MRHSHEAPPAVHSSLLGTKEVNRTVPATTMAGSFDAAEATRHSRFAGFDTALKRASAEYRETRGKCDPLARAKRNLCNAEARADERRAFLRDTDDKDMAP